MQSLPIDPFLPEITQKLSARRTLVLVAEPGAGKTTRVPPGIVRAAVLQGEHPAIVMLQPRRVAARAAAARIAQEQGWELGREVGYHVRFEKRLTAQTQIRVLTEGVLSRQLVDNPFLEGVGCVILDEFHERSLHTDVALALLREVRETVRPDLRIMVMSATLDAGPVAAYLGGEVAASVLTVPGRTFPIEVNHRPPAQAGYRELLEHTARVVMAECSASEGDVLVFLPGAEEIRRVARTLEEAGPRDVAIVPLFGSLTLDEQQRAIEPDAGGRQKVILATNIAETSLTIEGVRTVIDTGLARVASFDAGRGLDRLDLKRISRASATQRAGRAGRTGPGRAVRLWSAAEDRHLKPFELPDIRRVDLAGTVLTLHAWGKSDPRKFGWFEPPAEETLSAAEGLLEMLGAIGSGGITSLGRRMLAIAAHPRIARLLVAAGDAGVWWEGATLAALLSEKDIVKREGGFERGPRTQANSDLLVRLGMLEEIERSHFAAFWRERGVDLHAARQVVRTREELLRSAGQRAVRRPDADEDALLKLILAAYPDRVVRRRDNDPWSGVMVGGGGVRLARESAVVQGDLYVAVDARNDQRAGARQAVVNLASAVRADWLEIHREEAAEYDAERDRVVGVVREKYRGLVVAERCGNMDGRRAGEVLAEVARGRVEAILANDDAATQILARIELLSRAMPERNWPTFHAARLGEILANLAYGRRSIEDIKHAGIANSIKASLGYPLDRILEEEAPETIEVPSGSRIRIQYSRSQDHAAPPILAVRLQELFGLKQTPRIAAGRVPLLLHLLSPAYRPVQITHDLASFWAKAYFEVRKDLRVQYPKHSWPEDPVNATPIAKGGRRRS